MAVKSNGDATTGASIAKPVFSGHVSDQSAVEHIISIQAAERMRIADELHDTACQLLAIIQLNLGRMRRQGPDEIETTIAECEQMITQIGRHIRKACSAGSQ